MRVNSLRVMLGADPDVKITNSGSTVVTLFVAENRRVKRGDEWLEETDWYNMKAFGRVAEWISEDLSKGDSISFEGNYTTNKYEDKEGNLKTSHNIIIDRYVKLARRND